MFTTFKANNTPLFVDGQQFYVPQHYGKIMGYDKPLNFRIRDGVTESQANAQDRWSRWTGQEKQEQQSKDKKDL